MQTAHELFLHELSDMLDAERKFLEVTGQLAESVDRDDLKKAFETHRAQTEKQIERLEQCFEELGEEAEETECAGVRGLAEEFENFQEEEPSPDILDVFCVVAGTKGERYEITAYESLIRLADMMEHKKVSKLLNQNLKEEQQMEQKLVKFASKVEPENLGMEEEEELDEEMAEEEDEEMMSGDEDVEETRPTRSRKTASKGRKGRAA